MKFICFSKIDQQRTFLFLIEENFWFNFWVKLFLYTLVNSLHKIFPHWSVKATQIFTLDQWKVEHWEFDVILVTKAKIYINIWLNVQSGGP